MQFWETKMNSNKNLIYFLLYPSFSFKVQIKRKNTVKSFFLKKYIFFFFEIACITFYVTWKKYFLQNVVKINKKV